MNEELKRFERRFYLIVGAILIVGLALMFSLLFIGMIAESLVLKVLFLTLSILVGIVTAYFTVNCPWYYKKEDKTE